VLEVGSVTLPPHLRTGIQASFGPLLVSLSVFLWNQEEPSKLAMLAVLSDDSQSFASTPGMILT